MTTHDNQRGVHRDWQPEPARCIRCSGPWHADSSTTCAGPNTRGYDDDRLTLATVDQCLRDWTNRVCGDDNEAAWAESVVEAYRALRDDLLVV